MTTVSPGIPATTIGRSQPLPPPSGRVRAGNVFPVLALADIEQVAGLEHRYGVADRAKRLLAAAGIPVVAVDGRVEGS